MQHQSGEEEYGIRKGSARVKRRGARNCHRRVEKQTLARGTRRYGYRRSPPGKGEWGSGRAVRISGVVLQKGLPRGASESSPPWNTVVWGTLTRKGLYGNMDHMNRAAWDEKPGGASCTTRALPGSHRGKSFRFLERRFPSFHCILSITNMSGILNALVEKLMRTFSNAENLVCHSGFSLI
jgi:hypothetical protein